MKITVGIPSHGRPLDLAAAVLSLDKTKSQGGHEVDYIIAYDEGDGPTEAIGRELVKKGLPVRASMGPRPLGLGELHNRMVAATDPDATFLLWSDRIVPINENWDHAISVAVMQFPLRVLWMDSIHLVGAGQFILPPKWRLALCEPPCPAVFPFWFEDSVIEELDSFVHGHPRVATYAKCAGPRTDKTTRMRDLDFWIDLYTSMRPRRIEQARAIGARLGVAPRKDLETIKAFYDKRDEDFHARAEQLTAQYSAGGEPDASYIKAKANAEAMMAKEAA